MKGIVVKEKISIGNMDEVLSEIFLILLTAKGGRANRKCIGRFFSKNPHMIDSLYSQRKREVITNETNKI